MRRRNEYRRRVQSGYHDRGTDLSLLSGLTSIHAHWGREISLLLPLSGPHIVASPLACFHSETVSALRQAVHAYTSPTGSPSLSASLARDVGNLQTIRVTLFQMCAEAHAARLPPERMLRALKEVWATDADKARRDVLYDSVLATWLEVFFACVHASVPEPRS